MSEEYDEVPLTALHESLKVRYYLIIGEIIVKFNELEWNIDALLATLIEGSITSGTSSNSENIVSVISSKIMFSKKLELAYDLFMGFRPKECPIGPFQKIIRRSKEISEVRNNVAHGYLWIDPDGKRVSWIKNSNKEKEGLYTKNIHYDFDKLSEISKSIDELIDDISIYQDYMFWCFRPLERRGSSWEPWAENEDE